jgi:DNA polymerase-3 subunit gamma/tau
MDNYIVSARKYRPLVFQDVVGQHHITDTLEKAIANNHLAQALLFCGPRGVGKTTCARIVARKINEASGGDPSHDYSLNIFELDAASNNSVDDIRNLIDQVRFAPQVGQYKVYIIDEVHMLSQSAFNAFLKTLEEPPAHAIFILATTEKHKIIPTILSRCQIFDFKRIGVNDIAGHLKYVAEKENITADENALHIIAQKADGALRDSLSIFDRIASFSDNEITYQNVLENLNILDYDYYFKVVDLALQNDPTGLFVLYNEILVQGFDGHLFVNGLASHIRDLMMCTDPKTVSLLEVSDDIKSKYLVQAKACSLHQIFRWLKILNDCDQKYKMSSNQRFLVEIALSEMTNQFQEAVAVAAQKKKPESNPVATASSTLTQAPATKASKPLAVESPKAEEKREPKEEPKVKAPEATNSAPPSKPLALKSTRKKGRFSIANLSNDSKEAKVSDNGEEEYVNYGSEPFDEALILKTWKAFTETAKDNKPLFAVLSKTPKLIDTENLQIELDSTSQEAILDDHKSRLLKHLRSTLKNSNIYLQQVVKESEKVELIYTPEEKFKYMAKKNPALLELKKRLDMNY